MKRVEKCVAVELELAHLAAVELDHGDPLEVCGEQPIIGLDVDLPQLDPAELVGEGDDRPARVVSEVATVATVQRHHWRSGGEARRGHGGECRGTYARASHPRYPG